MNYGRVTKTIMILVIIFGILIGPLGLFGTIPSAEAFVDGSTADCIDFELDLVVFDADIADEGWVWVDPQDPFHSVSGLVTTSKTAHNDLSANHDSHDQNVDILVDTGYEFLLSDVNKGYPPTPNKIEMEWENGIRPFEKEGDGLSWFPNWAWPSAGDRVWVDGHWVFDCGHGTDVDGVEHFRTEIHPARAIASMRDQVFTLPGTGVTPVRGVATDLYIHGNGGFMVQQLYCGMDIILADDPDSCTTKASPIDEDFDFDIILPPKPSPSAILVTFVEDGPGNTVNIAPILEPTPAAVTTKVHVTVPLDGSGVSPDDVYARKIYAGWIFPPEDLQHYSLTLNLMDLHSDQDLDPSDCECTFFWLNVDRATGNEWIRLADFATGNMNDYDDDGGSGNGEMGFSGADFEYYVAQGMPVNIEANGYEQDCIDSFFGFHEYSILPYTVCYHPALVFNFGNNDKFDRMIFSLPDPDYQCPPGSNIPPASGSWTICTLVNGQIRLSAGHEFKVIIVDDLPVISDIPDPEYDLYFTLTEIPLTNEDTADLSLTKTCAPGTGQSFNCTIIVDNHGPGLPRNVVVEDTLTTNVDPADYTLDIPTFTIENSYTTAPLPCTVTPPDHFSCELGTVPVDGRGVITFTVTARAAGDFDDTASVTTDSTDPNPNNNEAEFAVTIVDIDIKPGDSKNTISINNDKNVRVAILGTSIFDVTTVDISPLSTDAPTFGGLTPRAPTSTSFEDINGDGLVDLVLKYKSDPKNTLGFQSGDTQGCLIGKLTDGTPILGCDPVRIIK